MTLPLEKLCQHKLTWQTPMRSRILRLLLCVGCGWSLTAQAQAADATRWEQDIQQFERQDETEQPPAKAVLFVGSSSIRLWNLSQSFPQLDTINRGFGGSQIADTNHYFDRLVTKYQPRAIVFYAGDNDIAAGLSPADVAEDFAQWHALVRQKVPAAKVVYIGIKPSLARWKLYPLMAAANEQIKQQCQRDDKSVFVDVAAAMLGGDGLPLPDLFGEDGLHLSPGGYQLWSALVRPHISPQTSGTRETEDQSEHAAGKTPQETSPR